MLTKIPFYFGVTRNATVAFGALFSDLFIVNKDKNGESKKIIKVPLQYSAKDKYVVKMQQSDIDGNKTLQVNLPRASFVILDYSYDPERQLNKVNKMVSMNGDRTVVQYAPSPYNLTFELSTYTKTQEDSMQLMEQIVPFFRPDLTLKVKMMESPEMVQDIPLILNSVVGDDSYDGAFEDSRMIIMTYTFTMKLNYYSPLKGIADPENHFPDGSEEIPIIKKVYVNVNNNKYTAEVDPFTANKTDVYNILESWTETIPRDFDADKTI